MWVATDCHSKNWVAVLKRLGSTAIFDSELFVKELVHGCVCYVTDKCRSTW
jgi:hypothetical protein